MSEIYNLKWDEHYSKVVLESFWSLLGQEVLTDCTLVCNTPSEAVQVHRLILSANSPYFRTLLKAHSSHPHPIIILHDVDVSVLKMLVTFMYRGEVNVSSSTFPLLLKTAENLQIIGLSQSHPPNRSSSHSTTPSFPAERMDTTPTNVPPQNPQQQQHYSKKARILEQGGFGGKFGEGGSGCGQQSQLWVGEAGGGAVQDQPLALRKKESLSAPSTPISSHTPHGHTHTQPHPLDYYNPPSSSSSSRNDVTMMNHYEDDNTSGEDEELEELDEKGEEFGEGEGAEGEELRKKRRSLSGGGGGVNHRSHPHSPSTTPTLINNHSPTSPLTCPYCPEENSSPSSSPLTFTANQLTRHIQAQHPGQQGQGQPHPSTSSPQQILCKFCSKPFPEVSSLIQHLPIHTGERPFKCEFCGKAFKLRHHMKDHARVHTGERPFRCGLCGKTFSRSTILKAHEKTHFSKGGGGGGGGE